MRLATLLEPHHIVAGLVSRTVREAVAEIFEAAERFHPEQPVGVLTRAVLERESQGSTALERGVAVPHARVPGLRDFHLLLGIASPPLDDPCLDGSPVELLFVVTAGNEKNVLMLQTLAAIAEFAQEPSRLAALKAARDRQSAWAVLRDSGVNVKEGLSARTLMRPCPVIARYDMTLGELLDACFQHGVHEAPVCADSEKVIGAVTSEEIVDAGFPDYMSRIRDIGFLNEYRPFEEFFQREMTTLVGDIMNRRPLVVEGGAPLIQVVFQMRRERQRFAFVEENGRLAGMVDRNDILSRILRA